MLREMLTTWDPAPILVPPTGREKVPYSTLHRFSPDSFSVLDIPPDAVRSPCDGDSREEFRRRPARGPLPRRARFHELFHSNLPIRLGRYHNLRHPGGWL